MPAAIPSTQVLMRVNTLLSNECARLIALVNDLRALLEPQTCDACGEGQTYLAFIGAPGDRQLARVCNHCRSELAGRELEVGRILDTVLPLPGVLHGSHPPLPGDWEARVREAYVCVRKHNSSIPDDTLDLMRDLLLAREPAEVRAIPAVPAPAAPSAEPATEPERSLGARLRAAQELSREERNRRDLLAKAEHDAKLRAEIKAVTNFFTQARDTFSARILAGKDAGTVPLDSRKDSALCNILTTYSWNDPKRIITDPSHRFHFAWQTFAAWAHENELEAKLKYEHDGVGIHAWHELTVIPRSTGNAS